MRDTIKKFYQEIEKMALTEGDKAIVEQKCEQIAERIIQCVIEKHIQTCPHGRTLLKTKMIMVGIAVGSGIASGGTVVAFAKFLFGG